MSLSDTNFHTLVENLEAAVRRGDKPFVLQVLQKVSPSDLPRTLLASLGDIARRIGEPHMALKLINPLMTEDATTDEKVFYSAALMDLGLLDEAQEILSKMPLEDEVLLHRAWVHFGRWNYSSAIPLLKKYVASDRISPYKKIVGQVNLLASYVATGQSKPIESLSEEIGNVTKAANYHLLYGNTQELLAQFHIFNERYQEAQPFLTTAEKTLRPLRGVYYQFVKKWQLICQLMQAPTAPSLAALTQFQSDARQDLHWEIVRDCELYRALATKNQEQILKVIFGTPYPSYRQRARRLWGQSLSLPKTYDLQFSAGDNSITNNWDQRLMFSPISRSVLAALSKDFFKPISFGGLFSSVYPGEYYDPHTSVKRIHNAIHSVRQFLKEIGSGIEVQTLNGEFFLTGKGIIRVHRETWRPSASLKKDVMSMQGSFTAQDLALHLKISKRSAQQIIRQAIQEKKLVQLGKGRASRYLRNNYQKRRSAS